MFTRDDRKAHTHTKPDAPRPSAALRCVPTTLKPSAAASERESTHYYYYTHTRTHECKRNENCLGMRESVWRRCAASTRVCVRNEREREVKFSLAGECGDICNLTQCACDACVTALQNGDYYCLCFFILSLRR